MRASRIDRWALSRIGYSVLQQARGELVNADGILDEIKAFIQQHIDSVVQLEILLLAHAKPEEEWTADHIARTLGVSPEWVAEEMRRLCAHGLLRKISNREDGYQFATDGPDAPRVHELAEAYTSKRVRIITLICSKPIDRIRVFSDAFKFTRDEPDG